MKGNFLLLSIVVFALAFGRGTGAFARSDGGIWEFWSGLPKRVEPRIEDTNPLRAGDQAPFGSLTTADGKAVDFEDFIRGKPTLFIFYPGSWSPEAGAQMDLWVKLVPRLKAMGYQVAAITPDKPEKLRESISKHHLNYTLFSDRSMDVTRRFGLAYRADVKALKKKGVDLDGCAGNGIHALPHPAVYAIDRKGVIRLVILDPSDDFLAHPENLLKAAGNMLAQ